MLQVPIFDVSGRRSYMVGSVSPGHVDLGDLGLGFSHLVHVPRIVYIQIEAPHMVPTVPTYYKNCAEQLLGLICLVCDISLFGV